MILLTDGRRTSLAVMLSAEYEKERTVCLKTLMLHKLEMSSAVDTGFSTFSDVGDAYPD